MATVKSANTKGDTGSYEEILDKIDGSVSEVEAVLWRLINFDSDARYILSSAADPSIKGEAKYVEGKLVFPSIDIHFDGNNDIAFIEVGFVEKRLTRYAVETLPNGWKALKTDLDPYVLNPIHLDTVLLLLLNKRSRLAEEAVYGAGISPDEFDQYLAKAASLAASFKKKLEEIPETSMSYLFSYSYAVHVWYGIPDQGVIARVRYYNIDGDVWRYVGINDFFVNDPEKLDRIIPKAKRERAYVALVSLENYTRNLPQTILTSYLTMKMMRSVQTGESDHLS